MSRPKNPDWTVEAFAPDTNFAAGPLPWQGNPTKVVWAGAASNGFTPKTGVPAQCVNYYFNKSFDHHAKVKTTVDAIVTFVGQGPALNWLTVGSGIGDLAHGVIDDKAVWWVVGGTENARATVDWGQTWNSSSLVAAAGANENVLCIDFHNQEAVLSTDTRYVFKLEVAGSVTVTKVDVHGGALTAIDSCVAYDPINALWCWVACDNTATTFIRTSPDRTTWTSRTSPFTSSYGPTKIVSKKSTGLLVLAQTLGAGGADETYISTSLDGGITWTTKLTLDTSYVAPTDLGLAYNPDTNVWLLTIANTGTSAGEVWKSTNDGAAWTKVCTLANDCIVGPAAPMGSMWVAHGLLTIVRSLDDGATWQDTGFQPAGDPKGCFAGGGGVLAVTTSRAYLSMRVGDPTIGTLT